MNTVFTIEPGVEVLVFRTNIRFKKDLRQVSAALDNTPGIRRWNVERSCSATDSLIPRASIRA